MTNHANKPNTVTTGGGAGGAQPRPRSTPLRDPARTSHAHEYGKEELEPTSPALLGVSPASQPRIR